MARSLTGGEIPTDLAPERAKSLAISPGGGESLRGAKSLRQRHCPTLTFSSFQGHVLNRLKQC